MNSGTGQQVSTWAQRWGRFVVRHARLMLIGPLLVIALLVPLALNATQNTVPDGWLPDDVEAVRVQEITREEFGRSDTTYYLLFHDEQNDRPASDPTFVRDVQFAVRPFRAMPEVASVVTWGTTRNDILNNMLISADGYSSLAVITLHDSPHGEVGTPDWIRQNLGQTDLNVSLTGLPVVGEDFRIIGHNDLVRAELLSLPITLVLLFVVFRGLIPALMPVVLAAASMIATLAIMALLSRFTTVNVFTVNTVTMLGLAVGIDYALILVGRFREEIANHDLGQATTQTLATAGRTIFTAGSTLAIGLSGRIFFNVPAATTTALLGISVVAIAMLLALTALPAALLLFHARLAPERATPRGGEALRRVEHIRERHPVWTMLISTTLLIVLTLPVLQMRGTSPGINNLPENASSRVTAEMIQHDFPAASTTPIEVVITPQRGSMLGSQNLARYQSLTRVIADIPGVQRVESLWSFVPATLSTGTLASGFVLEPELVIAARPFLTPDAALMTIIPESGMSADDHAHLVTVLRDNLIINPPQQLSVMVGGTVGLDLDLIGYINNRVPTVVMWILVLTAIALFIHLRSLILPIKAILLNLVSMGASFGALVWIFQDGHLAHYLGVSTNGTTVLLIPVLMFCFLFGLSMDFEIIMLSRIRESWLRHGDTTRAVDEGLQHSAGIITSSAVLMLTVFLAFSFSDLDVVKALGIGLSIAVVLDATIVRLFLLPATMQIMGDLNWWPARRR